MYYCLFRRFESTLHSLSLSLSLSLSVIEIKIPKKSPRIKDRNFILSVNFSKVNLKRWETESGGTNITPAKQWILCNNTFFFNFHRPRGSYFGIIGKNWKKSFVSRVFILSHSTFRTRIITNTLFESSTSVEFISIRAF